MSNSSVRSRRDRMNGLGLGPGGECIYPQCKYTKSHQRSVPCFHQKCPKCGTVMIRAR